MLNTKLIRILKTMQEGELKQLDKFIASPFFNESKNLMQFFAYLRKLSPNWEEEKLEKEKIWKKIFPKEPFNDTRFRQNVSQLFQLVEKFITQHLFFTKEQYFQNRMAFYNKRYLEKDAKDTLKEWEAFEALKTERSEQFYDTQTAILFHKSLLYHNGNTHSPSEKEYFLPHFFTANETHFILMELKWGCVLLNNHKRKPEFQYEMSSFIPIILQQVAQNESLREIPAIHIHYLIYQMLLNEEDESIYDVLSEYMDKYPQFLTGDEWASFAVFLRNYCIKKAHHSQYFTYKLQALYEAQLKNGIIFSFNQIPVPVFRNMVDVAIKTKNTEWLKEVILTYNNRFPAEMRAYLADFAYARIAFAAQKWKESLHFLNKLEKSEDLFAEIAVRILYVKVHYELQEWDIVNSLLETFKVYIHRQETLSEYYKNRYKNFIFSLHKMIRIEEYNAAKKNKISKEIREIPDNQLAEKEWLLEKMERLM